MNSLRNKVQLIGNLGVNPEIKILESGKKMAKFSIATNETYKNAQGEKVTDTQWHNIVAWGKTADFATEYLKKGQLIHVEGVLRSRQWVDKTGINHKIIEIICSNIIAL